MTCKENLQQHKIQIKNLKEKYKKQIQTIKKKMAKKLRTISEQTNRNKKTKQIKDKINSIDKVKSNILKKQKNNEYIKQKQFNREIMKRKLENKNKNIELKRQKNKLNQNIYLQKKNIAFKSHLLNYQSRLNNTKCSRRPIYLDDITIAMMKNNQQQKVELNNIYKDNDLVQTDRKNHPKLSLIICKSLKQFQDDMFIKKNGGQYCIYYADKQKQSQQVNNITRLQLRNFSFIYLASSL